MHYFLDTEFNEFGGELISLALVRRDGGPSLYVATRCKNPGPWVKDNVIPIIHGVGGMEPDYIEPHLFGRRIADYLHGDPTPIIVADWPDDIRYFCAAVITAPGEMVNIPRLGFEMLRVDAYPTTLEGAVQHNAWWDAMALRHLLLAGESGEKDD